MSTKLFGGRFSTESRSADKNFLSKFSSAFRRTKNNSDDRSTNTQMDVLTNASTDRVRIATPWRRGQKPAPKGKAKKVLVSSFATVGSTPFDDWITREWWNQIDRSDLEKWRRVNSGEFEAGLRKMMPFWMPVDRDAISYLLNSLHISSIDKKIAVLGDLHLLVSSLRFINKTAHFTSDLLQNQHDKMKETYPYSDSAARIYPNDISVIKAMVAASPSPLFSRTTQFLSLLSNNHDVRGVVIFYCNLICYSFRVRKDGYTGGTNQNSIEPTKENEMALPNYAAARQQYMEMFDLLPPETEDDASIQSPIYTERFASENSDTFRREGGKRLGILTETREKEGLLYLLDTSKQSESDKPMSCVVNLKTLTKVSPAQTTFSTIDLYDGAGLIWQLHPVGVDEDDANASTKNLLQYVSMYMNKAASIIRVIKQGFLMKKGRYINTSWQSRWCILSSDLKLRYYKYENGQYQGTIDIASVSNIQYEEGNDNTFTLLTMERNWILQAPTRAEKKNSDKTGWIDVMCSMLEDIGSVNVQIVIGVNDQERPSKLE